ncbi:carbohydrate ABC transporter permease [Nocardiopsis sp. NRRL B-16309]|uniref:carbohydrate ABC transporter permease n=1 Tax=Nocardiopsis sp. NRRL B-16309 TaxID=1519494 RepID=UPI0006B02F3A|nr:carbohydrate ABC transporter permease [Nocardiopsis sp. NRRL B-16309]KOX18088.1 sugar ABC transporter permease [Nocardiopsis sp. NRRL B-16309]
MATSTPPAPRTAPGPAATASRPAAPRRRRWSVGSVALYTVATLAALLWFVPLLWAFATSVKTEGDTTVMPPTWLTENPTFEAYQLVLGRGDILRWTVNSLITTVIVTVLTLILCVLAAYGFSRFDFRGRPGLFALVVGGILIPPQTLIVPQFVLMTQLGLVDTYWGVALPQVVAPVFVFILKRFFDAIPRDYEDAARLDGAGPLRVLWSVILPLSRPILTAVGIFTFIGAWNNFLWPFIVTNDPEMMTLPVGLGTAVGQYGIQYAQVMASAVLGAIPLLVVFLLFQKHIVTGVAGAGIKG